MTFADLLYIAVVVGLAWPLVAICTGICWALLGCTLRPERLPRCTACGAVYVDLRALSEHLIAVHPDALPRVDV